MFGGTAAPQMSGGLAIALIHLVHVIAGQLDSRKRLGRAALATARRRRYPGSRPRPRGCRQARPRAPSLSINASNWAKTERCTSKGKKGACTHRISGAVPPANWVNIFSAYPDQGLPPSRLGSRSHRCRDPSPNMSPQAMNRGLRPPPWQSHLPSTLPRRQARRARRRRRAVPRRLPLSCLSERRVCLVTLRHSTSLTWISLQVMG